MRTQSDFTEGKILGPLLKFSLPVLFAMLLQAMYGAADLLIVGQFGAAADVSAVSTGSQIMQTITSVITGLSMGTTILLGQKIGQKKPEEAGNVIGAGVCIFAVLALFLTAAMTLFAGPFCAAMQAPAEAFDKTVDYVRICSAGAVFIVAYNVLGSIFRGMGDSKTPLLAVFIACICNILGDLLFVAVFHMAAAGAALATVLAQALSVVLCVLVVRRRGLPFPFSRKNLRFHRQVIFKTLKLGFPIALQDALVSISFLAIIAIVNSLGVIPSAGGAVRAMVCGMLASLLIGVAMAFLAFFHGDFLSGLFARDPQVIAASADYLRAYAVDTLLVSFLFCFSGYFNGCGKTTFVMAQGIAGAFLVRIPVSFLMSRIQPVSLFLVGLATPCSTVVQILLCAGYFYLLGRKRRKAGSL